MAINDLESTKIEFHDKRVSENQEWQRRITQAQTYAAESVEQGEEEKRKGLALLEKLTESEKNLRIKDLRILELEKETSEQKQELREVRAELKDTIEDRDVKNKNWNSTADELANVRATTTAKISDLDQQVEDMSKEVAGQKAEIDHVYDELRRVKNHRDDMRHELDEFRKDKKLRDAVEKERLAAIARKPKHSFKSVALVVILCIRYACHSLANHFFSACPVMMVIMSILTSIFTSCSFYIYIYILHILTTIPYRHNNRVKKCLQTQSYEHMGEIGQRIQIRHAVSDLKQRTQELSVLSEQHIEVTAKLEESEAGNTKKAYRITQLLEQIVTERDKVRL